MWFTLGCPFTVGVPYIPLIYLTKTYCTDDFKPEDNASAMLLPCINISKAIMEAATSEPSVKHIVITSSLAAVLNLPDLPNAGHTYTGKEWNRTSLSPSPWFSSSRLSIHGQRTMRP